MKRLLLFFVGISFLVSCELDTTIRNEITSDYLLNGTLDVYLQNNQVFRYKGKPGTVTIPIGNPDLSKYEDCFVLHVATGTTQATTVSSAIVKLDGLEVLNTSDFSKNTGAHTFEVCNLTQTSSLTVEVRGEPGSYLDLWIEGKLKGLNDCDGNTYKTVTIGDQIWMAENLKTTKYNDGTDIPVVDPPTWNVSTDGYYTWYNYDSNNKDRFGAFYNWYAVNSGKLCPVGWHVPSDEEWHTLTLNIDPNAVNEPFDGTETTLGNVLKEQGTTNWYSNIGTNETGFTARAAGIYAGGFGGVFTGALWWSGTLNISTGVPWYRNLGDSNGVFARLSASPISKSFGFSVRCLKDN